LRRNRKGKKGFRIRKALSQVTLAGEWEEGREEF
jgi:hypothetical protein